MKVAALIDYLRKLNPKAEVVVHRDNNNYGYGYIDTITTGLFTETDYGNDFFPDTKLIINPEEVQAICIFAEDYDSPKPRPERKQ